MSHSDGGKGSGRRKEDVKKVHDNWDLIFGAKKKDTVMNDEHTDDNEIDHSEEEWCCDVCGGPMYSAAHWNYGKCDDCGAKQELISDEGAYNDDYV